MAQNIFIDISGYNLYKYQANSNTFASFVANVTPSITKEEDEHGTFMRAWSRVPIKSNPIHSLLMSASTAVSGMVYVEPDFVAMNQQDTRHPQFAYIKASHGTAGPGAADQYPIVDYLRPAVAALKAGWGIAPYHFYYMDMKAVDQANCLFNSINASYGGDIRLFGTSDPIFDIEDSASQTYKSFAWDGNSDPSRQIANIKYFLGSVLKLALTTADNLFTAKLGKPVLTRIYSGAWFWNPMVKLLLLPADGIAGHAPWPENKAVVDWYANRLAINAWYSGDHQPFVPTDAQKMIGPINAGLQYTSTAVPPMVGLNVPGMDGNIGTSLDLNLYLGTDYEKFMGVKLLTVGTPPTPPPTTDPLETRLAAVEGKVQELLAWKDRIKSA